MTVIEVIKKYGLEDYDKHYENCIGENRNITFKLDELKDMEVKSLSINFPTNECTITLRTIC